MRGSYKVGRATIVMVCAAGLLAGCGSDHGSTNADDLNTGAARSVMQFPAGFRNVAVKCDGPNMVYSASRGGKGTNVAGAVAVVANDARCGTP